jgi:hypothetical protein
MFELRRQHSTISINNLRDLCTTLLDFRVHRADTHFEAHVADGSHVAVYGPNVPYENTGAIVLATTSTSVFSYLMSNLHVLSANTMYVVTCPDGSRVQVFKSGPVPETQS